MSTTRPGGPEGQERPGGGCPTCSGSGESLLYPFICPHCAGAGVASREAPSPARPPAATGGADRGGELAGDLARGCSTASPVPGTPEPVEPSSDGRLPCATPGSRPTESRTESQLGTISGSPGGRDRRGFWTRFWEFAEEYPLGPIDWLWTKITRRAPGLSGPAVILVVLGLVFGAIIASAEDLGPARWIGLVPILAALAIAGVYKLIRDAIVRRIHK